MSGTWIMDIPSIVFSRLKMEFPQKTKDKLGMTDKNFSTVSATSKTAVFPFVFVSLISASEQGQTLVGEGLNAGMFSFQVDVIDNQSQNRAREVMTEIMQIMKRMRFDAFDMPTFESTEDTHRCTSRFRRMIGSLDSL